MNSFEELAQKEREEIATRQYRAFRTSKCLKMIGEMLYNSHYSTDWNLVEPPTAQEVLDNFCQNLYGLTFEQTIRAYDNFLG